jgi:hypothetical protein
MGVQPCRFNFRKPCFAGAAIAFVTAEVALAEDLLESGLVGIDSVNAEVDFVDAARSSAADLFEFAIDLLDFAGDGIDLSFAEVDLAGVKVDFVGDLLDLTVDRVN